ncbi:MAG: hypothetical protein LBH79_03100 [Nitrososphaerota archaeon]|jgi:uncharacterized protein YggL (DUF469 family)|nr:hypothetical protein [Nitrososphaerota archaeon]
MPQETQPWETKTIKQAVTDGEEQIYLKLGGKLYFMIENEINETENNGEFNFSLTSPFITDTLNCKDETTIQELCQKVINHIFDHAVKHITQKRAPIPLQKIGESDEEYKRKHAKWKQEQPTFAETLIPGLTTNPKEMDKDRLVKVPTKCEYHITYFTTKPFLGIGENKHTAQVTYL